MRDRKIADWMESTYTDKLQRERDDQVRRTLEQAAHDQLDQHDQ